VKRLLLGLCGLAVLACVPNRREGGVPDGAGPLIVVYKAAIDDGHGARRGAKLALWAERPDRLHAELMAPVGGVTFILDAGGGKVCVIDVAAGTAYVGEDGPGAIADLTGVRVSVAEAVAALIDGVSPEGVAVVRGGRGDGTLPDTLRIDDGGRILAIERVRVERGRTDPRALGTGVPPATLRVRPLTELAGEAAREPANAGGSR
jgi:hypothetical protein